jgi:hypothetical protein
MQHARRYPDPIPIGIQRAAAPLLAVHAVHTAPVTAQAASLRQLFQRVKSGQKKIRS